MNVSIGTRELTVSNLDKVLFPSGFTKAEVIDYYTRIAPVMLPHLDGRNVTMVRYPNGVNAAHFFAKAAPSHSPDWIERVALRDNTYIVCREVATLVFMANLAALELHVPLHRAGDGSFSPDAIAFDLDPGPGCGMNECAEVALLIAETLQPLGLPFVAKTSGSKGMQLYARAPPGSGYVSADGVTGTTAFAKAAAKGLEAAYPEKVVAKMTKALRPGKIFIDWSQNVGAKTTVCVYSLRARHEPIVSTPLTWQEVEECAQGRELRFTAPEVLARVERFGDLFAWPERSIDPAARPDPPEGQAERH